MTRIGSMTGDIVASFFKKVFTEKYPYVPKTVTERARGEVAWDESKCTGCRMCVKDCPAEAIEVTVVDRVAKKYSFEYHRDRCVYCGQCIVSCKPGALSMPSDNWHLASTSRETFVVSQGQKANDLPSPAEATTQP